MFAPPTECFVPSISRHSLNMYVPSILDHVCIVLRCATRQSSHLISVLRFISFSHILSYERLLTNRTNAIVMQYDLTTYVRRTSYWKQGLPEEIGIGHIKSGCMNYVGSPTA